MKSEAPVSKKRTIVVTGGSRGIGSSIVRLAAGRGYDVAFSYRGDKDAAESVARDVRGLGRKCFYLQADVADPGSVLHFFEAVDRESGVPDVMVANAGMIWPGTRFVDISHAHLMRVLQVNLAGAFLCGQEAVKRMARSRGGNGGVIVNVSSMAAKLGGAFECLDYAISKGGMDTMTIGMAKELASEGIRVNGVRPGLIDTDMQQVMGDDRIERLKNTVPLQRGGTPEEVAATVLWLCSDEASYLTGVTVDVSGGRGL